MALQDIKIHIKAGIIRCTPNGGNSHVSLSKDTVRFGSTDAAFTLVFQSLNGNNTLGAAFWPFREVQPRWPIRDTGPLTLESAAVPYLKYTVSATGCTDLDPIIIIER